MKFTTHCPILGEISQFNFFDIFTYYIQHIFTIISKAHREFRSFPRKSQDSIAAQSLDRPATTLPSRSKVVHMSTVCQWLGQHDIRVKSIPVHANLTITLTLIYILSWISAKSAAFRQKTSLIYGRGLQNKHFIVIRCISMQCRKAVQTGKRSSPIMFVRCTAL
jgi:hypothetical protein